MNLPDTDPLRSLIAGRFGIEPDAVGPAMIDRAIALRMNACGASDRRDYALRCAADAAEGLALMEELVIPETWFFRDGAPFDLLRDFARGHMRRHSPARPLRVLSIPCSTGEEAWSIAVTLREAGLPAEMFRIEACDISERALATARDATYGGTSFREPLTASQQRFFRDNGRALSPLSELAGSVTFRRANILDEAPSIAESKYDVIFCRNLIIYMNDAARERIADSLRKALAPGGLLVTGHAEIMYFLERGFLPVEHPRCFTCTPGARTRNARTSESAGTAARRPAAQRAPQPPRHEVRAPAPVAPPPAAASPTLSAISALADGGAYAEAFELCEEFLRRNSQSADGYALRGMIEEALHRPAEALASYDRAIYLNPSHYEALIHACLLYEERGDPVNARAARERATRLRNTRTMP